MNIEAALKYEQIVDFNDISGQIQVQIDLFNSLDEVSKAALVVHEGVYAFRRDGYDMDSVNSRHIVGLAFSSVSNGERHNDIESLYSQLDQNGNAEIENSTLYSPSHNTGAWIQFVLGGFSYGMALATPGWSTFLYPGSRNSFSNPSPYWCEELTRSLPLNTGPGSIVIRCVDDPLFSQARRLDAGV
jgi:hypothetical protein